MTPLLPYSDEYILSKLIEIVPRRLEQIDISLHMPEIPRIQTPERIPVALGHLLEQLFFIMYPDQRHGFYLISGDFVLATAEDSFGIFA
jgi:hypothetical protein